MDIIERHAIGVERGSAMLFSDFEDGGSMWTGEGPRLVRRALTFPAPFQAPPTVLVAPEMWDYDTSANIRGDLTAEDVTERGFDIVFKVWADTRIARLRASWIAIGSVKRPDDWDL